MAEYREHCHDILVLLEWPTDAVNAALQSENSLEILKDNLQKLKRLVEKKDSFEVELQKFQRMMIFVFCITSLESYLFDVFSKKVFESPENKEKYLKVEKGFEQKKLTLAEIIQKYKSLDNDIN
jgi:hypothetical protein